MLEELAVFLKKHTNSTGVYIGKLTRPKKTITDDSDDKAHLDAEAPEVVQYIHASDEQHKFLIDQFLSQTEGLTHDVFIANPPAPAAPEGETPPAEVEAEAKPEVK